MVAWLQGYKDILLDYFIYKNTNMNKKLIIWANPYEKITGKMEVEA